ncbi:metallophosphoesterase family protein [Thetidibacter halocola]|uniref:Metallophosphoesterase family protein n=1 Tax=Thetidibacter halocola TaxID=2827239 RepID=A0A8J7WD32_9RHOB|nr:metallophosphoesterase family protein [Thetidibacter halocola]MBS0122938.1 metallophosphoesterase family protein [Thetidibacter halocola]
MRLRDLGELRGPVLAFGGPYSNFQALDAVLAEGARRAIPRTQTLCTGDVVAYGADAAACVARMRAEAIPCIAGNVERQIAAGGGDCGCGFGAGSTCDRLSAAWYAHASAACDETARAWMEGLPGILIFRHAGRRGAVIHGGVTDISRFLWPSSPDSDLAQEIAALAEVAGPVDIMIAGHCGMPFIRQVAGVTWVNAGAIGLPPHDGRPQTAFATLDADGSPALHRLEYDHETAAAAMEVSGLIQGYHAALRSGWWPSEDILPPDLRRR